MIFAFFRRNSRLGVVDDHAGTMPMPAGRGLWRRCKAVSGHVPGRCATKLKREKACMLAKRLK
jgi:hypothetical protein